MDWPSVINWLSGHGGRILLIIVLAVALYYALHHFVPLTIKAAVARRMADKPEEGLNKGRIL